MVIKQSECVDLGLGTLSVTHLDRTVEDGGLCTKARLNANKRKATTGRSVVEAIETKLLNHHQLDVSISISRHDKVEPSMWDVITTSEQATKRIVQGIFDNSFQESPAYVYCCLLRRTMPPSKNGQPLFANSGMFDVLGADIDDVEEEEHEQEEL